MQEQQFEYIYLTTEDKHIIDKFQNKYGNKLLLSHQTHVNYDGKKGNWISDYIGDSKEKDSKYMNGMEYLAAVFLLSYCDGLILTMTSGTVGLMCLSEKNIDDYDYYYVFDLGRYE